MKGKIGLILLVVLGLFLFIACENEPVMGSSSPDGTPGSSSPDDGSGSGSQDGGSSSSSSTGFSEMTAFLSSGAASNDFNSSVVNGTVPIDSAKAVEINSILSYASSFSNISSEVRYFILLYTGSVDLTDLDGNPYAIHNYYFSVTNTEGDTSTDVLFEADVIELATSEEFHINTTLSTTPQWQIVSQTYKDYYLEATYNRSTSESVYKVNGNIVSKEDSQALVDSILLNKLFNASVEMLSGEEKQYEVLTYTDPSNEANTLRLVTAATSTMSQDQYSIVATLSAEIDGHKLSIKAARSSPSWTRAYSLFNSSYWNEWTILNFTYDEVIYQISSLSIFDS